jgi:peptidoglycan/xylan/chitin deacetylase (PgdA/CDA1 family)
MNTSIERFRQNEAVWDLFTRKEEYSPVTLDQYGRFIHSFSSYHDIQTPLVSKFLLETGSDISYPDDKPFAVCLTHDVNEIYPPFSHVLRSSLTHMRDRRIGELRDLWCWKYAGREHSPYLKFKEIMNLEERYEARSSFFVLASDEDIRRFRYHIEDLDAELGEMVDRGWEVGLHGGYYAYDEVQVLQQEKNRLERVLGRNVIGYRNHFLRFKVPDTWRHLVHAGFKYDTTLGYPDAVGFRNGMCHPHRPVDLADEGAVLNILEIPMIIMDDTLFGSVKSMNEAWVVTKRLIDVVESCRGTLTLNWHSQNLACPFLKSYSRLYERILNYCSEKNAWMASGEDIWRWWTG